MGHYDTIGFKVTLRECFVSPIREMYRSFVKQASTPPWQTWSIVREAIAFHAATHPGEEAADLAVFLNNVQVYEKMDRAHTIPFGALVDEDLRHGVSRKLEDFKLPVWEVRCSTKGIDEPYIFFTTILSTMIVSCAYAWSTYEGDPYINYQWDGRLGMSPVIT